MNLNKRTIQIGIILAIILTGCQHDSILAPKLNEVSFVKDIMPIMNSSCNYSGCHNSKNLTNFPLESYSDVINYGQVIAFKPVGSNLYDVIANGYMPRADTLGLENRKLIFDWIANGALNN
jgi:hypothetical protein